MTSLVVPSNSTEYVNAHRPSWERAIAEAIGDAVNSRSSDPLRTIGQKLIAAADASTAGTAAPPPGDALARAVAEARTVPASQQASDPNQAWKMAPWLDSLGTSGLIETALMAPVREGSTPDDPALVLPFVRALGKHGSRETVAALIRQAGPTLLESLATTVWDGVVALGAAGSATGRDLHDKFVQEGGAFTMSCTPPRSSNYALADTPNLQLTLSRLTPEQMEASIPFSVALRASSAHPTRSCVSR